MGTASKDSPRRHGEHGDFEGRTAAAKRDTSESNLQRECSKLVQVVHDLGVGPVDGADEFAANDAILVDDVGLGKLEGAVLAIDGLVRVAHGEQIDVMIANKLLVGLVV